jgi:hypothetical protein
LGDLEPVTALTNRAHNVDHCISKEDQIAQHLTATEKLAGTDLKSS